MPRKATPMVAMVDHELPVITDTMAQATHAVTRNHWGLSMSKPYSTKVGTTPDSIHVVAKAAIHISIGMAGSI